MTSTSLLPHKRMGKGAPKIKTSAIPPKNSHHTQRKGLKRQENIWKLDEKTMVWNIALWIHTWADMLLLINKNYAIAIAFWTFMDDLRSINACFYNLRCQCAFTKSGSAQNTVFDNRFLTITFHTTNFHATPLNNNAFT